MLRRGGRELNYSHAVYKLYHLKIKVQLTCKITLQVFKASMYFRKDKTCHCLFYHKGSAPVSSSWKGWPFAQICTHLSQDTPCCHGDTFLKQQYPYLQFINENGSKFLTFSKWILLIIQLGLLSYWKNNRVNNFQHIKHYS